MTDIRTTFLNSNFTNTIHKWQYYIFTSSNFTIWPYKIRFSPLPTEEKHFFLACSYCSSEESVPHWVKIQEHLDGGGFDAVAGHKWICAKKCLLMCCS